MIEEKFENIRIPVPPELADVFSHFYYAKNNTKKEIIKTLVPNFQGIFIFSFGEKVVINPSHDDARAIDKFIFLSPIKHALEYNLADGSEIFVINFIDDAVYRFFGSTKITNHNNFEETSYVCFSKLWQKLKKINNQNEKANFIINFCKPYLAERNFQSELLLKSKDSIFNPIKKVAVETEQTVRSIQLHHKKHFGYSAKEIQRYVRFLRVTSHLDYLIKGNKKVKWFEIIELYGYYDQSHLISDFKHFLNISPSSYLKLEQSICNPAILK